MGAPGVWQIYNQAKLLLCEGGINLETDTFKMALFTSSSNVGGIAMGPAQYGAANNQLASGNGYTTGGVTLATTWTGDNTQQLKTFDTSDAQWSASGGDLVFRYAVIYDDTATDKPLLCYCLMDATPADFVIPNGTTRSVEINAAGVFTLGQA